MSSSALSLTNLINEFGGVQVERNYNPNPSNVMIELPVLNIQEKHD